MYCADIEIKENMTAEEIKEAEKKLETFRKLIKILPKWRSSGEIKIPINFKQIDVNAKDLIATIGVKKWTEGRGEILKDFEKKLKEAEEILVKAKENLKKKKA